VKRLGRSTTGDHGEDREGQSEMVREINTKGTKRKDRDHQSENTRTINEVSHSEKIRKINNR
jgi:hypothetical protein